jgi:hypothetical protein
MRIRRGDVAPVVYEKREKKEKDESIEIDPFEILDQLSPEDLSTLLVMHLSRKDAELIPLRQELQEVKQLVRYLEGQKANYELTYQAQMKELRSELSAARERILELTTTVTKLRTDTVVKEQTPRTILVRTGVQMSRDSSDVSSRGNMSRTVIVHRKPRVDHVPAGAMTHVSEKITK